MDAAQSKLKSVVIEAQITRADGTVEAPQVIAFWHSNAFRRLAWSLRRSPAPETTRDETAYTESN